MLLAPHGIIDEGVSSGKNVSSWTSVQRRTLLLSGDLSMRK